MDTPNGHCMVANPHALRFVCMLARGHRSLNHVDQFGYEWSDAGQLSGDRPRKVMEDRMRRLLAYVEKQAADKDEEMGYYERQYARPVYAEIAIHLKNLLDTP